jgi:TonB family protein
MFSNARAGALTALFMLPVTGLAQTGPSEPQVIAAASTPRINVGQRKLSGYMIASVNVDAEGRVSDLRVVENSTESGFEEQLIKVLRAARFRPAIDEAGRPVASNIDMKVELRTSTGNNPKPVAALADPQLTDKEKARIARMKCPDFLWEWRLIREAADDAAATEFMPRIATAMYASMRSEAGDYVDAKVWKESAKGLRDAAERCEEEPQLLFWEGAFRPVMDEAIPK